ncbi:MAG: YebC/PmpR family DNA-binding transcriptional regulator [Candidatus Staskawiczbacteria bacterium]|nr:YebC/PmpR family DNA-binding transcriptional regulator [Candidatus Staskawiczbacteria bacterium]
MSGHSHAKTVMATKMANDAKKGKVYSKYGRLITIAVKEGGGSGDPEKNSKLKTIIEQAKGANMPKENIERAIKKGTGELAGESLESVSYEGFGPGGIAIIIDGITDNPNRTLGEVRSILNQNGGKMAGEGAVRWMFERKGIIVISADGKTKEDLELMAIELGADDVKSRENKIDIYTKPEDLEKVKKALEEKQIKAESVTLDYVAKEEVALSEKEKEQAQRLFDALDDNDAVNEIYSNIKN